MFEGVTFQLKDRTGSGLGNPKPAARGIQTGEEQNRVDRGLLERIYYSDPIVFNAVNTYVHTVTANRPSVMCEDGEVQDYMDRFVRRTKLYGDIVPKIAQNIIVFGCAYNEVAYSEGDLPKYDVKGNMVHAGREPADRNISRLFNRDPKYMDFFREGVDKRIIFNEYQEPAAFVLYIPSSFGPQEHEINVMGQRAIKIPSDKVMYTTLFTLGDSLDGIGLIEPSANASRNKSSAEQGFSRAMYRLGHGIVGVSVGSSDSIFPDKDDIDNAADMFKDINESSTIAYPYYLRPEIIETKRGGDKLREQVGYFTEQQVAGFGMAAAMATGQGQSMNRSILDKLMILFYQKISMIQEKITQSLEGQVFAKIAQDKGWNEVPRLVWSEISTDLMIDKAKRVSEYIDSGAITASFETEAAIREMEGLPGIERSEYDEALGLKYIHQRAKRGQKGVGVEEEVVDDG